MGRTVEELTSARTVLRHFAEEDQKELLALFRDPSVRRYLLDDAVVSAGWVRDEIASSRDRFERSGAGLWSIRLKEEVRIIGFAGFRGFFDPPQLQLLYGLLPAYWGSGLATEVASTMCDYAFDTLEFDDVAAAIDAPNVASARVLARLGMVESPDALSGCGAETACYVLRRGVWEARRASGGAL